MIFFRAFGLFAPKVLPFPPYDTTQIPLISRNASPSASRRRASFCARPAGQGKGICEAGKTSYTRKNTGGKQKRGLAAMIQTIYGYVRVSIRCEAGKNQLY